MKDKTKLIFRVEKKIWLNPKEEYFVWTTSTPSRDIGKIEKDSVLIFSRLSPYQIGNKQPLEFVVIRAGNIRFVPDNIAEFFEDEIENLTKDGVLKLLDTEDIDEMTITLSALGEIFIKKLVDDSFSSPVLLPKDIFIVMEMREYNRSNGKLTKGDKISLREIIDAYSKAIGKGEITL